MHHPSPTRLTIAMASTALDRIDTIVARPLAEINDFVIRLPGGSFDALKEMDWLFGKQTVENKIQIRRFTAWRNLNVNGMELRFKFSISEDTPDREYVMVCGYKSKDTDNLEIFEGPSAYDSFPLLLCPGGLG